MAIKIFLPDWAIKNQEDTTIIETLKHIFTAKGAKLKTININDIEKNRKIHK